MDKATLRGELLVLRPVRAEDADARWEMVCDPESRRLTGEKDVFTREQSNIWCATVAERGDRLDWAITHTSDEYLGEIVLDEIDADDARATLRMSMRPSHRGRGLGGEAIGLALAYAFGAPPGGCGLHRVGLEVLSINPRARMLYENHGFVVEGRRREWHSDGRFWCDSILMAILEDDYRERQGTAR